MAKIVGVSGAHGTGKTTVLRALEQMEIGDVRVDAFSVARHMQKEYVMPLADIVADPPRFPEFQDKIVYTMVDRVGTLRKWYKSQDDIMFIDQTPVDAYAAARIWLTDNPVYAEWVELYEARCAQALRAYDLILLVPPRTFVEDTGREGLETQAVHHSHCVEFLRKHGLSVHVVCTLSVGDRCNEFLIAAGRVGQS